MPHDDGRDGPGLSRRDFLKVGTAGAIGGSLAPGSLLAADPASPAAAQAAVLGPGAVPVTLDVNGKSTTLSLEPRATLLDALRDQLDLTGAKKVCDRGTCGACTVLLDGRPAYACSVLALEARGRRIETVESLGNPEKLHPLQAAFVENDALQCGACTPGFVMACHALLARNASPTPQELADGLGGNACRCGTYDGIRKAVTALSRGTRG